MKLGNLQPGRVYQRVYLGQSTFFVALTGWGKGNKGSVLILDSDDPWMAPGRVYELQRQSTTWRHSKEVG